MTKRKPSKKPRTMRPAQNGKRDKNGNATGYAYLYVSGDPAINAHLQATPDKRAYLSKLIKQDMQQEKI